MNRRGRSVRKRLPPRPTTAPTLQAFFRYRTRVDSFACPCLSGGVPGSPLNSNAGVSAGNCEGCARCCVFGNGGPRSRRLNSSRRSASRCPEQASNKRVGRPGACPTDCEDAGVKNQVEPGPDRALASAHRVVIVGGGFAGLYAAKRLGKAPLALTLIDRRNFHLFQPLLYQVATGGLSPGEIAFPLRVVLRGHRNTEVLLAEVVDFDIANRRVILADGERPYEDLVISTGATHFYFGHDEWETLAPDDEAGRAPGGDWTQLVGSAYDRTIHGFQVVSTAEQDERFIAIFNDRRARKS